jgi:hypothetical protein
VRYTLLLSFIIVVITAAVCVPNATAQSASTSALTGRVTDPTGAVLPGVTVTATASTTNQARTAISGEDGVYRIPLLDPGSYRVRFGLPGFKTSEVMDITLTVTETSVLNRTLEIGSAGEQVTVEAAVEALQTATATLGTTVTGTAITTFHFRLVITPRSWACLQVLPLMPPMEFRMDAVLKT